MPLFFGGLVLGFLLAGPLALWMNRRTRARVQRLAQRAQAAERLAELGKLTGGLAHEIKNPLSSVVLNIQLIQEDLRDLSAPDGANPPSHDREEQIGRVQRRVDALTREIQRLRDILEDFLRFAGRVRLELAPTDLNELIRELTDFFTPQAQEAKVRIRTQLPDHPAVLAADAGLLKQALLNLMINATQAIAEARQNGKATGGAPEAEELILKLTRARAPGGGEGAGGSGVSGGTGGTARSSGGASGRKSGGKSGGGGEEYRLYVIDTGPGIAPEQLAQIFQPYFSTKKTGTGLGLPTARRIIEEHGGSITVHSDVGRGTEFLVTLPVREDVLDKSAAAEGHSPLAPSSRLDGERASRL